LRYSHFLGSSTERITLYYGSAALYVGNVETSHNGVRFTKHIIYASVRLNAVYSPLLPRGGLSWNYKCKV